MIIGVFLRNIKTYQGLNYVPLSDGPKFCGLLGNNGVGKSSVLEAFDGFFNGKTWIHNTTVKKSGLERANPHIVPLFLLKKDFIDEEFKETAELINSVALTVTADNATNEKTKILLANYLSHREKLTRYNDLTDYYLLPLGIDAMGMPSLSILEGKLLIEKLSNHSGFDKETPEFNVGKNGKILIDLIDFIKSKIEYLYIPKEITPENFTRLESDETKALMGESLETILDRIIGSEGVSKINRDLTTFIDEVSGQLENYAYRTPTDRQQNLKKNDVYKLIQHAFFNIRKLHRKHGDKQWLEISLLSSGEKQKAMIDVAHSLLTKRRENRDNLIVAVDEPEASLHMSACFDQFDTLIDLSKKCMQLVFTSHWYGFMPTIENGSVTVITKNGTEHYTDLVNLGAYREEVKQLTRDSKGQLPFDIRIKSINDFIQSIISSSTGENPYNWIICEGSSEKIYLSAYLNDLVEKKRLRIVPVGGAKEVKRVYTYLSTLYQDIESEITGTIYLLSDTDSQLVSYQVANHKKLFCKRIVYDPAPCITKLVSIDSNPISPETEIENGLNAFIYWETLMEFSYIYPELEFIRDIPPPEPNKESYDPFNLRGSEKALITQFFDKDNNKFKFAESYIARISPDIPVPNWILELRDHF